ncbi:MAG: NUDIX hydrolase [Bradyrhizobium sp.]|uniref:NUDIX domain-containing protein n=1 Tax=Bradyrhizobium sp. TaxID=376 RepID=UPI001D70795E|nr:NUDIX hydrolase [Bradyrhizobium sp.]MBV9561420.1 NUDIX hydrolase [Bradyrhizobium sp.]
MKNDELSGDRRCPDAELSAPQSIGCGHREYHRFFVSLDGRGDVVPQRFDRDILRSRPVVGVLAIDPVRDEVALTRQFRLAAHLALDRGEMVEIVAGGVDDGESLEQAARRECREEIGAEVLGLVPLCRLMPAPAFSDELMNLFVARIDSGSLPLRAGVAHECEDIEIVRCSIEEAIELIGRKAVHSAPTIVALQWLALNREMLTTLLPPEPAD